MPPISLCMTPIHHRAEVCSGNLYWIFNEREYNAIQSQWVCQCPRTLHTQSLRCAHTHAYTQTNHLSCRAVEIALHFPNSVKVSALKGDPCNCVCLLQTSRTNYTNVIHTKQCLNYFVAWYFFFFWSKFQEKDWSYDTTQV